MRIGHLLKHLGLPAMYGLAGWALTWPLAGQAATTMVTVEDFNFNPPAVTINVNDSVQWNWTGIFSHNSKSDPTDTTLWDSGFHTGSGTFTFHFPAAGTFPYSCTLHLFTGTVTVQGSNNPPSVGITSPTNGATFIAPWAGTIQATVSDLGSTVSKMDFFANGTLLGTVTSPSGTPSFTVTNLAADNYTLTAVATDSNGLTNTPVGVDITVVTPGLIILSSPQRLSATSFQFNYTANPGLSYIVLRSAALSGLLPISTNTAPSGTVTFLDSNATGDANFYGVHLAPNP
jgi:plastocyanin